MIGVGCLLPTLSLAQMCNTSLPNTTPNSQFVDNADGTVTDTKTGLMWQKCVDGRSGSSCENGSNTSYTWPNALLRAESLNNTSGFANQIGWRLPNLKELLSITEKSCFLPAINLTVFPNIDDQGTVWSSTPYRGSNDAYLVNFLNGISQTRLKEGGSQLRLVRDVTPNPVLSAN